MWAIRKKTSVWVAGRRRCLFGIAASILFVVSCMASDVWPGFRGLERQGANAKSMSPIEWSGSKNVAWRTEVPGRGHSSPIVYGDNIYLTTTYERESTSSQVWAYGLFAAALVVAVAGVYSVRRVGKMRGGEWNRVLRFLKTALFAAILTGLLITALFGEDLLDIDESVHLRMVVATLFALGCVVTISLLPLRGRWSVLPGALAVLAAAASLGALLYKGLLAEPFSSKGLVHMAVVGMTGVVGLGLVALGLRRGRHMPVESETPYSCTGRAGAVLAGCIGLIFGLLPYALVLYRAAGYKMPDRFIWDERVSPNAGWYMIAVLAGAVAAAVAGSWWKSAAATAAKGRLFQGLFIVAVSGLGAAFFVRLVSFEKTAGFVRAVMCLDRTNGDIVWTCEGPVGRQGWRGRTVTYATPTPATDGQRIYAYFGEDGLLCTDMEGDVVWHRPEPLFHGHFAAGISPVVEDGVIIIVADLKESAGHESSIMAFDCEDGRPLWRKKRRSHPIDAGNATPIVKTFKDRKTVFVHGWHDVAAYELRTGDILWSFPLAHEGKHLVASLTSDDDGRLFAAGAKKLTALTPGKVQSGGDAVVWSAAVPGEKSSSPVLVGGLLFLITEPGMAYCVDADGGEIYWKERFRGRFFSSVVAAGKRAMFTDESGTTRVVAAEREFELLAENKLGEPVYASIVPVDGSLLIRGDRSIYCISN